MARWTSMTKQQFSSAFREGQRAGRVSWSETIFKFIGVMMVSLAYQAIHLASSHGLTQHKAAQLVGSAAVVLLLSTFILSFSLRSEQSRVPGLFPWAMAWCVGAGIVFIICLPQLS